MISPVQHRPSPVILCLALLAIFSHAGRTPAQIAQPSPDVAGLIQAVKSQIQTVEELKKQNSTLARQNEEMARKLKSLETKIDQRLAADPLVGQTAAQVPPPPNPLPAAIPAAPEPPLPAAALPELPPDIKVD